MKIMDKDNVSADDTKATIELPLPAMMAPLVDSWKLDPHGKVSDSLTHRPID